MEPSSDTERQTRQLAVILHSSHFLGWIVPVAGWAVPIAIWVLKKDELPEIAAHGKVVVNWLITQFLASLVLGVLAVVFFMLIVTWPLFLLVTLAGSALWVCGAIFAVVGAIRANEGEVWSYPGSIPFFT